MRSQQYLVEWHGPYRWYGKKDECLFKASEATQPGIYLWTIPFNRKYLTYARALSGPQAHINAK